MFVAILAVTLRLVCGALQISVASAHDSSTVQAASNGGLTPGILVIGGRHSGGIIEKYSIGSLSDSVQRVPTNTGHAQLTRVRVAPVNGTHAFLILFDGSKRSYFIDANGKLTEGPHTTITRSLNYEPFGNTCPIDITSIQGEDGQMRPIYCETLCDKARYQHRRRCRKCKIPMKCKVLSNDGRRFEDHSDFPALVAVQTLTAFGADLIVVGSFGGACKFAVYKYKALKQKWTRDESMPPTLAGPESRYCSENSENNYHGSTAVALMVGGKRQLLLCGPAMKKKNCYVYNLDDGTWEAGPELKTSGHQGELVVVGSTVHLFGGTSKSTQTNQKSIQTLDISIGVLNGYWKLESDTLTKKHAEFGVAVFGPDLGKCANRTVCADGASCSNWFVYGSYGACTCNSGFSGDGHTGCTDVDECNDGSSTCDSNATCTNTQGGFTCACDPGFVGDGFNCVGYGTGCL